jgi:hypothetical protein
MTKKEFKANLAYLENEGVCVSDEPVWDYAPNSRELFFETNCGGDFSICVEEVTRTEVLEYLNDYDVSEATSMWWDAGNTPFGNIGQLYEDISHWKEDFIKIAEGMPY